MTDLIASLGWIITSGPAFWHFHNRFVYFQVYTYQALEPSLKSSYKKTTPKVTFIRPACVGKSKWDLIPPQKTCPHRSWHITWWGTLPAPDSAFVDAEAGNLAARLRLALTFNFLLPASRLLVKHSYTFFQTVQYSSSSDAIASSF